MSDKSKNILLGVLIVGLVSMTVAYAALSTSLSIRGTATVEATNWDIHFTNVRNTTTNTSRVTGTNEGTVTSMGSLDSKSGYATSDTGTLINGLTVNLVKPGDYVSIDFDIVNTGTIDAKLGSFTKSITRTSPATGNVTVDGNTTDGITYTVKCADTEPVALASTQELARKNGKVSCTLEVVYEDLGGSYAQKSQTAGQDQTAGIGARTFSLTADWQYIQK